MLRTTLIFFLFILLQASASEETLSSSLERTASTGSEREELTKDRTSRVFGANLFSSEQRELIASAFNPAYVIQNGDNIRVQIWGAYVFNDALRVDEQGNVFIPEVGPISVAGTQNKDLTKVLMAGIEKIYTQHVNLYANLETSQEVKVFVAGYVKNPGLYAGHASDNLLNYIHLAGGIDLSRGSFTSIQIKRGTETRESVNLYNFLTRGEIPQVQFSDGDVIFVSPIRNRLIVDGLVSNPYQFEFESGVMSGEELKHLAQPLQTATHFTIQRSLGDKTNALTHEITTLPEIELKAGDKIVFSANRQKDSILIKVEGEHDGAGFISLAYGTSLGELYDNFEFNSYSSSGQIQLFRESTRARQKSAILDSLKRLEDSILSARSSTSEESLLRLNEANLLLKFIDRAAQVEPLGQVILNNENWRNIRLEDNDKIIIPGSSSLIAVQGEVNFPNTQVFAARDRVKHYIKRAGGFSQNADTERIIILRQNGEIQMTHNKFIKLLPSNLRAGDEIIVLPRVDRKNIPIFRDLSQIIYNIAIATKVVLDV